MVKTSRACRRRLPISSPGRGRKKTDEPWIAGVDLACPTPQRAPFWEELIETGACWLCQCPFVAGEATMGMPGFGIPVHTACYHRDVQDTPLVAPDEASDDPDVSY